MLLVFLRLLAHQFCRARQGSVDMVADILPANHLHQPRFLQRVEHMVVHTRQHQLNAAVLRAQIQLLQVVDAR